MSSESPMEYKMESDYFSRKHSLAPVSDRIDHARLGAKRASVSFLGPTERPHPKSRMSTHRLDNSRTNFAEVLHDNGGTQGLRNLDIDYFRTVLDVFRDQKQHHSPVVFDFMLLHEINIHHLEHLLIAEWDWLVEALSPDKSQDREMLAQEAPKRLGEIRTLLDQYSVALKDFEEMRQRATLDEASGQPLNSSSWHDKLMHVKSRQRPAAKQDNGPVNTIRRLSNAVHRAALSKDDPEKFNKSLPQLDEQEVGQSESQSKTLFGASAPACRQLAGVEDWARERKRRELSKTQRQEAIRNEWLESRFKRFSLAFFAGLALIGPMVLMTLVSTIKCSLTTTSVATLLFALIMTYATQISERDIVVVTAGYAAVLVVFVGTTH